MSSIRRVNRTIHAAEDTVAAEVSTLAPSVVEAALKICWTTASRARRS